MPCVKFHYFHVVFLTIDKAYGPILHAWIKAVLPSYNVTIILTSECFIYYSIESGNRAIFAQ